MNLKNIYLFIIYLTAPGLIFCMQYLLAATFELLIAACGILFPDQGLNPHRPLHWKVES